MQPTRKVRRWMKAMKRRAQRLPGMGRGKHAMNGNKFEHRGVNWYRRIAIEMKDNTVVINNVASGKLDKELGFDK